MKKPKKPKEAPLEALRRLAEAARVKADAVASKFHEADREAPGALSATMLARQAEVVRARAEALEEALALWEGEEL